jgi:nitrite reductase (cytochrome c-552)
MTRGERRWMLLVGLCAALAAFLVTLLLVNVFERKAEARDPFVRVEKITSTTVDPAVWGRNFPLEYESYLRTVDQQRTTYGGSEALPHLPTQADPRLSVARSKIDVDARLKTIWAGYAFAVDYREKRGHAYMLADQLYTERQHAAAQPGTCLHCHASMVEVYRTLGDGDPEQGFRKLGTLPYAEAAKLATHPVACIDCHDPDTMALRITRPAFVEGIRAYKASQGIAGYDVRTMATRQEMRSYVCGQCHVEYYFAGADKLLTLPWAKGVRADEIVAYYDGAKFRDWLHATTAAPVLKAQHPEFEMWSQGVHARAGVACADCHMPYRRVGARKVSDHQVRSPLLDVNAACQTCHPEPEAEVLARAETIQTRFVEVRDRALDAVVGLVDDLARARGAGRPALQLEEAQQHQRKAQFYVDFAMSENSHGFHAPGEALRVLALAIDEARAGQVVLRDRAGTDLRTPDEER